MTEKSFEEQFPSLKFKVVEDNAEHLGYKDLEFEYVYKEDVQKHCLDKQRVKNKIDKLLEFYPHNILVLLKEELGLI
jgi:hypothetical protein